MTSPPSSYQLSLGGANPVGEAGGDRCDMESAIVGAHSNGVISKKLRERSYLRVYVLVKPAVDHRRANRGGCKHDDDCFRRNY